MSNTKVNSFVHTRVHSDNTILNGVSKVPKLIAKAVELEMPAIALTDICAMYGVYSFWSGCNAAGIKPIIGSHFHLAPRKMSDKEFRIDNKTSDLVLLAKNLQGYRNLMRLVSLSHINGFYYKPRIDKDTLKIYSEGLICITGNISSEIGRCLYLGEMEKAEEVTTFFQEIYRDDFYLDLQRTKLEYQDLVNSGLVKLSDKLKIKLLATNDVYYLTKDLAEVRDVMWAIDDGKKLSDPSRRKNITKENYLKSSDEMAELFSDLPQAISNSLEIASKVESYEIGYGRVQPMFPDLPKDETEESYLKKLVYSLAEERFGYYNKALEERLKLELDIIHEKGYDGYFLVMWSIVNYARNNDILVSTRGSAAGSAVSFALGITTVDPIKWGLFFERFLNPERKSFPDIDLDISDRGRDQLLNWVYEKYGANSVCHVGALGKLTTKAAIRDVGRVLEIDLKIIDRLSKLVPVKFGKVLSIDACLSDELAGKNIDVVESNRSDITEFRKIIASDKKFTKLIKFVRAIEGCVRHISTHACGVLIITPKNIIDYCPLQKESKQRERIITQLEGKYLEDVGFMKFDLLGLTNLSIIADTLKFIEKSKGIKIDIYKIPEDDKKTFGLLQQGDTTAVFQLESPGMRKYLKELKPETLEEISAMCALYRPGPIQFIPSYINRKFKKEEITYAVPEVEEIMKITYGLPVYQEQILQLAAKVAGYSLGEADVLRRAIGKKIPEVMEIESKKFKQGVIDKNEKYGQKEADILWSYALPFADYGFNKAHSAAYAMIAYQTAYLKVHYPTEFYSALMLSDIDNLDKLTRDIIDAEKHGIKLLKPDINFSNVNFEIESDGVIRFGIGGLKGVGVNSIEAIVLEREKNGAYTSVDNFFDRLDHSRVSKGAIESLIKIGALDSFGFTRSSLLSVCEDLYVRSSKKKEKAKQGLVDIFGLNDPNTSDDDSRLISKIPMIEEVDAEIKIEWEKQILGVSITKSVLHKIKKYMLSKGYESIVDIKDVDDGVFKKIYGRISNYRVITTKKGDEMCFFNLESGSFNLSVTVFPKNFAKLKTRLADGNIIIASGYIQRTQDRFGFIANTIKVIDPEQLKKKYKRWKLSGGSRKDVIKNSIKGEEAAQKDQIKIIEVTIKRDIQFEDIEKFLKDLAAYQVDDKSIKEGQIIYKIQILIRTKNSSIKQVNSSKFYVDEVLELLKINSSIISYRINK